jgi:hypothetical protein
MQSRWSAAVVLLWLGGVPCVLAAERAPQAPRPTDPEVRQVVRRLLGKATNLQRCQVIPSGSSYVIECSKTECRACNVTHVVTTLRQQDGQWAVAGSRRERRGDTGECGCCM